METDSLHDTTVSVVDGDPGGFAEVPSQDDGRSEERSSNDEMMREIGSDLIKLERDIAFCSEKLVNMNLLMMHVAAKEIDFEAFIVEKKDELVNAAQTALQFDILSGFFDLEVKEMDNFIGKLLIKFKNACDAISSLKQHKHLGTYFSKLEEKLLDAEKSMKQSQEQVSELKMQSSKFQRIVLSANRGEISDEDKDMRVEENGDFFNTTAKIQMQTSEQQRHILSMLEKSLARELDLENQLTESMQILDKMKRKLHYSQQEVLSAEEETAAVYAQFLEADNASAVLMGISKELVGQLQSCQLTINSSLCRENELNTKLQNCMQALQKLEKEEAISQELAEKNSMEALDLKKKVDSLEEQLKASDSELLNGSVPFNDGNKQHEVKVLLTTNKELNDELDSLKQNSITHEKIESLEKQLRESDFELQQAMASLEASQEKQNMYCSSVEDMEIVIEKLKTKMASAESRAERAESEYFLLGETNKELNKELELLKANSIVSSEKIALLEKQLRETNIRLQQATASVEASQEKQTILCSSVDDMEMLIDKLKSRVLKADARADCAEDKCIILSESHAELNEELNFLREKVGCLEASLQQAEDTKLAAAKDISLRTKVVTDLVVQLALERERLQKQLSWLMKDNRAHSDKLQMENKPSRNSMKHEIEETENGIVSSEHREHPFEETQVEHKFDEDVQNCGSNSESEALKSKLETVRTIDAGRLNFRYILSSASLVAFIAVLATCFLSPENCPF